MAHSTGARVSARSSSPAATPTKQNQTISFTSNVPAGAVYHGPTYVVTATATSGLPVTFTIAAASATVCSISGGTVSFIGVGTCTINADQSGSVDYKAAPQVQQSFGVGQAAQTISFDSTAPSTAAAGGPTYQVMVSATSGLAVNIAIDAGSTAVCQLSGSTTGSSVSFIGAGTCKINANQAGDANHSAADTGAAIVRRRAGTTGIARVHDAANRHHYVRRCARHDCCHREGCIRRRDRRQRQCRRFHDCRSAEASTWAARR